MNIRNFGIVKGRLTKDLVVFTNTDGSKKIMLTIAAQDNFKNKDGQRDSQFISLEAFVPAGQKNNGVFDYMEKGTEVAVEYTVRTNNYTDKNGEMVYGQVLFVQSVDLEETKASAEARRAAQAAKESTPAETAEAPVTPAETETSGKKSKKAPEEAPFN